jgi:isoleucyl-tRNA synthetase
MAPLLPHTADEAWAALHQVKVDEIDSVALSLMPEDHPVHVDEDWKKVIADRDNWLRAVEQMRSGNQIDNPLDLGVKVAAGGEASYITKFDPADLADLCSVSLVAFDVAKEADSADALEVLDLRDQPRCERSWKRDGTVEDRDLGEFGVVPLSARDAEAVEASLNA